MIDLAAAKATYRSAALVFADLVARIPADDWEEPGLGEWDLRALVGHTSRALSTVINYLQRPAANEAASSPEQYFARAKQTASAASPEVNAVADGAANPGAGGMAMPDAYAVAVAERGRQAGRQLGAEPATAVRVLVDHALESVDTSPDVLIETAAGGMYLRNYLPTRTFELAVHSLDIAAAAGVAAALPADVLLEATALAGRIAVELGCGLEVLTALTGRTGLPEGFTVV
ncbi:maleylpyruvate isomerase N-terminal domain-containing protein [Paenarthrobacter sp. Z7-10]|uniref:maleylpyruvate isomerase N-terminal domain-containing protein n=1 Tax=Paenarthrobacter sp. Z7-10 TaxID=2787635 RepID=UPI0022A9D9AF|nr:maleylpyruvate isomerase N-terminal domain-containing protein [Paenarthrobacter sp. Z7-10]MCZ2402561.1 maleylpyruvate isomerase N-terminal domain-containing protein [Paenarthrobacter sp. Z7-10]